MGDKPAKYWDYNECAWVACPTAAVDIPEQAERDDQLTPVAAATEADVRSE